MSSQGDDKPERREFKLPPPPRMGAKVVPAGMDPLSIPSTGLPPPPHSTNASFPVLESAPSSANSPFTSLPPPSKSGTITSLPLPPPPPPPSTTFQRSNNPSNAATPPVFPTTVPLKRPSQNDGPTIVSLPPPPVMSTPGKATSPGQKVISPPNRTESETPSNVPSEPPRVTREPLSKPAPLSIRNLAPKTLQLLAVRQTHMPVMVLATESAHSIAWKNGLLISDMLNGLMQQVVNTQNQKQNLPPFRSVSRSLTLDWKDMQVNFIESEQMSGQCPYTDAQAQQILHEQAALLQSDGNLQQELELLEDQVDNLLQEDTSNEDILPTEEFQAARRRSEQVQSDAYALTSPVHIPWLWRFRHAIDACTDRLPHDLIQTPVVCLLVCTTQEYSNPIETLQSLSSRHFLPPAYHNGLYDPAGVKHEFLVLHDNLDGPSGWDESGLRMQLQRSFGPGAQILRVNSISPETAKALAEEENSDLWGGGGTKGNCLSLSDRVVLRNYLAGFVTTSLLPAMERRIANLNVIVSDQKKGVKNVLKSFWRSGKKEDDEHGASSGLAGSQGNHGNIVRYRFDTIESQTLLLADSLFLMRDYDAAGSMYRLIRDDYKQDRALLHYGSVLEMMALSMYLTDPYGRAREIFSCIENALLSYSRAAEEERPKWGEKPGRPTEATPSIRLATRLCLVLTATENICDGRNLEVADLLASSSSNETSLGAAVLLEQSSAHYFKAEMYRKYAFHMLMSGHMFRSAEQEHHAFRCFTSALYIYRNDRWDELHNHLRSALAAQLYSMGRMATALQLYAKLVGSTNGGRVSVKSQQKFLTHLLEICNDHRKKALVGADRMAASSTLSSAKRDAFRKTRLDRISQVMRYTKAASRILELPNMDLPQIEDSTVTVFVDESPSHRQQSIPSFGEARRGAEDVWKSLMLKTTAELRAAQSSKTQVDDEVISKTLAKIDNEAIRKVIGEIDKEKLGQNVIERAKRSSTYKETPPIRAEMEPITVEFSVTNPLGIPIDLNDVQLVARMEETSGVRVCTNEDAIFITPFVSYNEKKTWTFQSPEIVFEIPDFCRVSSGKKEDAAKDSWKSAEEVDPFFVVSKTSITVDPECRKTVAISICPIVQGNLEIVGVRCRLLDDIWVFHPFAIKGPLLQNTRSNRAHRVRGEPVLLKAKVERGMPCLAAELVPFETESAGPALDGQRGQWYLRLSNEGTAPATSITLKTNLPWISFGEVSREDSTAPACVGPTGTLMKLDLVGKNLKHENTIFPGESVDIPIEIRPMGLGRQELYMLFRYELAEEVDRSTVRHRWLKKMFEVPVYPSLGITASVIPSYSSSTEFILSLELTNQRADRPDGVNLIVEKLSIASRQYGLQIMAGQLPVSGTTKVPSIGWLERMTYHCRIFPKHEGELLSQCVLASGSLEAQCKADANLSLLSFLALERAHNEFEEILSAHETALAMAVAHGDQKEHPKSIAQIRREASAMEGKDDSKGEDSVSFSSTSIGRLCPPTSTHDTIHVICSWRSVDGTLSGESYIRSLPIRPLAKAKGCPIILTAEHPSNIVYDFNRGPVSVPLRVTLRNRLIRYPVDFEFSMSNPIMFDFVGPQLLRSTLDGGKEMSVNFDALIPAAGVYNLQQVRLTINEFEPVSYLFPVQWLVKVDGS